MIDFLVFYMGLGLAVNWAIALFLLYSDDYVEIDWPLLFLTIPAWPYTLYLFIASRFEE